MPLFNINKPAEEPAAAPISEGTPVDVVLKLRQQGLSNTQIVEAMQRDGYKTHQIFDAMNQADLTPAGPVGQPQPPQQPQQMPPVPPLAPVPQPQMPQQQQQEQPQYFEQQQQMPSSYDAGMEEVAEAIIEEKWKDISKDISKVVDWKNDTEARIVAMEQKFSDLKDQFDKVHAAILGKITEYDESIKEVGSEVKAMEKVFQDVLPRFTENINELSRITKTVKKK
ncbi:MAG: hypothetical protein GY861_19480 [bacterium]|nr:hypothetical protein [bacterium]